MQTTSDILLGWTSIRGRPYYVRQFRDMKGSVELESLPGNEIDDCARLVGALLARAHSRSPDARLLAGYCGSGDTLDHALQRFAVPYADQTEADHAALVSAVKARPPAGRDRGVTAVSKLRIPGIPEAGRVTGAIAPLTLPTFA